MNVKEFHCFSVNEEWHLVEMLLDGPVSQLDRLRGFTVPEEGTTPDNWQAPYNEQYLNEDGTERICDLYDEPEDMAYTRVAFFIYKVEATSLLTPFGAFALIDEGPLPARLDGVIEIDEDDEDDD